MSPKPLGMPGEENNQSDVNMHTLVAAEGNLRNQPGGLEVPQPWPRPIPRSDSYERVPTVPSSPRVLEYHSINTPLGTPRAITPPSEVAPIIVTREREQLLLASPTPYSRAVTPHGSPQREINQLEEMNKQLRREAMVALDHQRKGFEQSVAQFEIQARHVSRSELSEQELCLQRNFEEAIRGLKKTEQEHFEARRHTFPPLPPSLILSLPLSLAPGTQL